MRNITKLAGIAGLALFGLARAAAADPIILYYNTPDNDDDTGSRAEAELNIVCSGVGDDLECDVTVKMSNTTDGSAGNGATQSDLRAVAFGWDLSDGSFTSFDYNAGSKFIDGGAALTGPFAGFDICVATSDITNCNGVGSSGYLAGESDAFGFVLSFLGSWDSASAFQTDLFSDFTSCARFQAVSGPDFSGDSDRICLGEKTPPDDLPEPGTLALFGLGLAGLGLGFRRRKV